MMGWITTGFMGLAMLGLAACGTEPAESAAEVPKVEEPAEAPMADEKPMAAVGPEAEANCLAAVSEQVGIEAGQLSVLSADVSEAGTSVMIEVPEATAPWNCVVDTDGSTVADVFFTDEEGAL